MSPRSSSWLYLTPLFLFLVSFLFTKPSLSPVFAAGSHIVISQVKIAGLTTTDEFIELYNPTLSSQSLSGWKLTRKNSSGTEANLVASISGTIPASGYFLIGHGTGYSGSVPLDQIYSAPSNALTNNYTVLLYDNHAALIDKVGFGSAFDFETSPFATSPAANSSIIRSPLGQDTDNNSIDFATLTPANPHNTSSVIIPAITPTSAPTVTPQPTSTPTPSPTPTQSVTPTPTQQVTPTPLPTEDLTPTPSIEITPTPTITTSPTVTPTQKPTPTPTTPPDDHHSHPLKHFIESCKHAAQKILNHFHFSHHR